MTLNIQRTCAEFCRAVVKKSLHVRKTADNYFSCFSIVVRKGLRRASETGPLHLAAHLLILTRYRRHCGASFVSIYHGVGIWGGGQNVAENGASGGIAASLLSQLQISWAECYRANNDVARFPNANQNRAG